MDSSERFNEVSLPDKEAFYSKLILEDISDEDNIHAAKVFEESKFKNLGECHDLYLKSDLLVLVDILQNFRKMCLEIYELDPAKFILAPGLAWRSALKKTQVKFHLLTDIDMPLMVERGIRRGIYNAMHHYAKTNNIFLEGYAQNKESSYLQYWDVNNL